MKSEVAFVVLAGIIATALFLIAPESTSPEFNEFKLRFGKKYSETEEKYRKSIFQNNIDKIERHNADSAQTYKMGVNQFTDMTDEEFQEKILMKDLTKSSLKVSEFFDKVSEPVANGVDWRSQGKVTNVKNQGQCGSCWSFSTTGLLESSVGIKKGLSSSDLPSYSEQQLVDCCGKKGYQCAGCNGAWPEWALNYVASTGIVSETSYPYRAVEGACQVSSGERILPASNSWSMVRVGDTAALKTAVGASPVSICVDAARWSAYKSGVFSNCGSSLDHAVLLVGYDDQGNWIVKNSWGTSWGERGYITLAPGNTCGLANHAIIARLA